MKEEKPSIPQKRKRTRGGKKAQAKKLNAILSLHRANKAKRQAREEHHKYLQKCTICRVELGEKKLLEHYNTELHKELTKVKEQLLFEARFHKTLDEQIEKKGNDQPFVGLKHIRQYEPNEKGEHTYDCTLCQAVFRPRTILYHVLSPQHRINYLAQYHKSMGIDRRFQIKSHDQYLRLMTCTLNASLIDGMQAIKIMNHVYVPKPEGETAAGDGGVRKRGKRGKKKSKLTNGIDALRQELASLQKKGSIVGPGNTQPRVFQSGPPRPATDDESPYKQEVRQLFLLRSGNVSNIKKEQPPDRNSGPSGIGMDVIKQALARLQQKGSIDGPLNIHFQSGPPPPAIDAESLRKREELLELLSTFLEGRSKMTGGSMSQEGAAPNQAGSNAPYQDAAGSGMAGASTTPIVEPCRPIASIKFMKAEQEPNEKKTGKSEYIKPETVRKVVPKECIPDFFWCNDELYNFLGHEAVVSQEDVVNALKVAEKLSDALVRHKQRADNIRKRIEEEKKKLEEEKKAFLREPGVNKALQKLEQASSQSPETAETYKGYAAGPSMANTNPSQQRIVGSQTTGFWQDLNRPQGLNTGSNTNPSLQPMAGSQFNQARPSDPKQALASLGSGPKLKQRQSRFDSVDNVQGPGMAQPIGGSRPTFNQPMNEQRPTMYQSRPGLGEQRQTSDQSRTQMNEGRQSWNEQRQALGRSWLAEAEPPESQSKQVNEPRPKRQLLNDSEQSFNDGEPPVNKSRLSWQEERPGMEGSTASVNQSEPAVNKLLQAWLEQRVPSGDQYSTLNKLRSLFSDQRQPESNQPRSSFNEQRPNEPSNLSNQPRPSSNQQRPPLNQSRASYGMSDTYTESDDYYKRDERFASSQYGNTGYTGGAGQSYVAAAGRPEETEAYYGENKGFASSQFGNYAAAGGAKSSYGSAAGGLEGSKDNYGYSSGYNTQYPSQYSSTEAQSGGQSRAAMGPSYGVSQGNWSSLMSARSGGPGTGAQLPYSSNQVTASYNESWKQQKLG